MRKVLSFILSLVLVFSLVACDSTNNESDKESVEETETSNEETNNDESKEEETEEDKESSEEDSVAEETMVEKKSAKDLEGENNYTGLTLKDNIVLANAENSTQDIYILTAEDNPELYQGHKYEFVFDQKDLNEDGKLPEIAVEKSTMLGKSIGYTVEADALEKILEVVPETKLVDARSAEEAQNNPQEGYVNIPSDELQKAIEEENIDAFVEKYLGDFAREDVVVVKGDNLEEIQLVSEIIYKVAGTGVVLNGLEFK